MSWRTFWHHTVFSVLYEIMTYFLTSWGTFLCYEYFYTIHTFDVLKYIFTSWHISWHHDILFKIMTYILKLWHNFCIFWHYDILLDIMWYYFTHVGQEMLTISGTPDFTPFGKWWCFRPLLCTLFRLNWAKQTPGIMRRNKWRNLPLSGFEPATQWSEAQHATAGLQRPPSLLFGSSWLIWYTLLNVSVLRLCLRINDSGLFAWISRTALSRLCFRINDSGLLAWISRTALSRTYFIIISNLIRDNMMIH